MERNAIIMAAGTSSRFVPLSAERPKGLLEVRGEILIERQIRQLQEAGITDITIVVGYKAELFGYLVDKFGISLVWNEDFNRYNNTSSIVRVLERLKNTYICSSDNYFPKNVFLENPAHSYYSALYAEGKTSEYCLTTDAFDNIVAVTVGGHDSWYMTGHVYFNENFSVKFRELFIQDYEKEETKYGYWEDVYIRHIMELPYMKMQRYSEHDIEEFDSIDELRVFDVSYVDDTRSSILKRIARILNCKEAELSHFINVKHEGSFLLFSFAKNNKEYLFDEKNNAITEP